MHVTLRQLKAFLAGTKSASFSEAAEKSFLTQPGYSLLIRQLEDELGVKLFDRTTRKIEVTKNGQELAQRLARIIEELDDTLEDAHYTSASKRGRVTLGIVPSLASHILGDIINIMKSAAPDVTIGIREDLSGPLVDMVTSSAVDLAIGVDLGSRDEIDFTPLTEDRMFGVFRSDDPILKNDSISWAMLENKPYIAFVQTSIEECVSTAFAESKTQMKPMYEVRFATTAVDLVAKCKAFTILPELWLKGVNLQDLTLRSIHPVKSRQVGILINARRAVSPAAQTLRDSITMAFSHLTTTQPHS